MRYIVQDDVLEHLPADWDTLVADAKAYVERKVKEAKAAAQAAGRKGNEVAEACEAARHKAINAKSDVWRTAEAALSKASHAKCWYCESKEDRSDKPVDHFRPKNSVIEAPGHPGYYWLAFDWKNYRYTCTFCNSRRCDLEGGTAGGKQDHFPVLAPPPHARSDTDPADRAKLLDPTVEDDAKLLIFLSNGFPHPAKEDPEVVTRVQDSVDLYHLKHGPLVRRRKLLAAKIDEHVSLGEAARANGNTGDYRHHKKQLVLLARAQAEFSSAARVYLAVHRKLPWVEELVTRDL